MFNDRCLEILQVLLKSERPLLVREIAELTGKSVRSVQYHLKLLNDTLVDAGLPTLQHQGRTGIMIPMESREDVSSRILLGKKQGGEYAASKEERMQRIFVILLQQTGYLSMEALSERLLVSRVTIVRDVQQLKSLAKHDGFKLETSPNKGIRLTGNEKLIRATGVHLLAGSLKEETALVVQPSETRRKFFVNLFGGVFVEQDFLFYEECLREAERKLSVTFSDYSFYALILQLGVMTLRARNGFVLSSQVGETYARKEQNVADFIVQRICRRFSIKASYAESYEIAMFFSISSLSADTRDFDSSEFSLYALAGRVLEKMGKILHDPEMITDERLFQSFFAHLRPAMNRLKQDVPIENPLFPEIRAEYPGLFSMVREGLGIAEKWAGRKFSDAEVAYFVLHFGTALERHGRMLNVRYHVLVVCDHGIGTSELIATRVQEFFHVELVGTVSRRQMEDMLRRSQVDVIVTSVELSKQLVNSYRQIPIIRVSPLLSQQDILHLGRVLPLRRRSPESVLKGVLQIVERHSIILDYPDLLEELSKLLEKKDITLQQGGSMPVLKDVLTEECIALNTKAGDWKEVIRYGGAMMEKLGLIEARYTDAMMKTVQEMGAYIVIAPGLAMPHARPEDGAKRVGTFFMTLESPVVFGNEEYDPVRVVVFLCAVDKVQHLKVLSDLMVLFENESFCDDICALTSVHDVYAYIVDKLEDED